MIPNKLHKKVIFKANRNFMSTSTNSCSVPSDLCGPGFCGVLSSLALGDALGELSFFEPVQYLFFFSVVLFVIWMAHGHSLSLLLGQAMQLLVLHL